MKQVLIFHTGKNTCYDGEKLCHFCWTQRFGTVYVCHLYDDKPLFEGENGMLDRHENCLRDYKGVECL